MKIIDARWEEKNSGKKTCEIIFEKEDSIRAYLNSNVEKGFEFMVVKVPIGNLELVHRLEDIGYRYLENQIMLSFDTDQYHWVNPEWFRLLNGFECRMLNTREEIDQLLARVNENMFSADRYSLDPFWPEGISSKRYVNWINEMYENGEASVYSIVRNGESYGFFTLKEETENIGNCPIAGIYNEHKSAGYIFVLVWFWLEISRKAGKKKLKAAVSSNNRMMLSSLSKAYNFKILETFIVMRKAILI
jgi:hypothetical protein